MKSIWSGAISFGLLYIPVKLYNASQTKQLEFSMLRKGDLCPIRYMRVCEETGKEVPYQDIVRGYQYEKGKYVVLEDNDFQRANVHKTQLIDIVNFVDISEVDPKYLEKPYYLEPAQEAQQVYALLREALKESNKVGLARFVLRTREHLGILMVEDDALVLVQMRFIDEIRPPQDLQLPGQVDIASRELDMAVKLIDRLTEPWQPEEFHDTYVEDLKRIIQEKIEGKEPEPVEEETFQVEIADLFAKLAESLKATQRRNELR